ncbi:RidA family protein [Paenibacillus senegalensis]|uniref:RidA family protein n=1 Tax=Paenibacillus senegalensis TaxID=1465766 RepID=UPI000288057D|nr:RidA family protein [Paenibacillus senegalensis]
MKKEIVIKGKHDKPFSSAIETESLVFISGQGGLCPDTGEVVGDDLESQTIQTLENIRTILQAAGLTMDHIVKTTIYLSDVNLYKEFNKLYKTFFQPPYPSRTAVYCELNYGLLVEIDAIAVKN